ncbi:MAG: rRNA methyltransferase [Candidatus Amulumruptor caecigallinarius]|uniref:RNA methyltransferase n=1 Tax=Candidatus Amulumruptor caecigallinarius TaxID=2109911 RepID=A0A4Q0UAT3_9BACT|nr:MAG: rRNA methyltransferase [Candidatus Amulumruptor caecigallinarius]HJE38709.1 RNA methyltransferase [Candidatus Amulumruptor caecigallinarius]
MNICHVEDICAPELAMFASLTDTQLRNRLHPDDAIIIVESPKVILTALSRGLQPIALLCEQRHITGDAAPIIERCPSDMPIYTGSRETLCRLTGYTLTRGVLCAMHRPVEPSPRDICPDTGGRIAVIDGVVDTTNIGAIFRSAAALGIDAVLLTRSSCDPYNRRAVRVSMGSVFLVPWAWIDGDVCDSLHTLGYTSVSMALRSDSVALDSPLLKSRPRLAIILGTEGDGLADHVIGGSDFVAKIPMSHGVDSLNVAAASAIAFYELTRPIATSDQAVV